MFIIVSTYFEFSVTLWIAFGKKLWAPAEQKLVLAFRNYFFRNFSLFEFQGRSPNLNFWQLVASEFLRGANPIGCLCIRGLKRYAILYEEKPLFYIPFSTPHELSPYEQHKVKPGFP